MSANGRRPGLGFVPAILAGLALTRSPASETGGPDAEKPTDGPGYETSDVHVRNTAMVMVGLAVAAIAVVGTMIWMMQGFAANQRLALPSLTPQQTTRLKPPPPNLQARPYADIDAERAAQAERTDGYAFTDASRQRARIPIDRAMALVVGRTLDP